MLSINVQMVNVTYRNHYVPWIEYNAFLATLSKQISVDHRWSAWNF